jgi:hypothetical protein
VHDQQNASIILPDLRKSVFHLAIFNDHFFVKNAQGGGGGRKVKIKKGNEKTTEQQVEEDKKLRGSM